MSMSMKLCKHSKTDTERKGGLGCIPESKIFLRSQLVQSATSLIPLQNHTNIHLGPDHMYLSGKRETGRSHTGFPSLESIWLFVAYLRAFVFYLVFTESWLKLIYLRYVGHVGWIGVRRLNMRRVNRKDGLLCCWETILWRLRIGGRCHGRWGWRKPRVVNG